jgi:hypothetical protein
VQCGRDFLVEDVFLEAHDYLVLFVVKDVEEFLNDVGFADDAGASFITDYKGDEF